MRSAAVAFVRALVLALTMLSAAGVARAQEQDLDDVLGGFEAEEPEEFQVDEADGEPTPERFWDLTGSVSVGSSINFIPHSADDGKDYTGLSRLRTRLNLQLDADLPYDWKFRLAGFGFYDWAYLLNGRDSYQNDVLQDYEWEADFQEVWVQGRPGVESMDLKIGRQIVNWGRSDNIRVIDILNPLDNREPGLSDIEDLRRPVMMVKLDWFWKNWSVSGIAIPEIRFSKNPVYGNDFAPDVTIGNDALAALAFDFGRIPNDIPNESIENTQWAARVGGIFQGWDFSVNFANVFRDAPHLDWDLSYLIPTLPMPPATPPPGPRLEHERITMTGAGANYTIGSWLFKTEFASLIGLDYPVAQKVVIPGLGTVPIPVGTVDKTRLDGLVGVEYYGLDETTLALEIADRHILDFDDRMREFGVDRNTVEYAVRVTRNLLNERLELALVGFGLGDHLQLGGALRTQAAYDLRDALVLTGGVILYLPGDRPPLEGLGANHRVFLELKYSF